MSDNPLTLTRHARLLLDGAYADMQVDDAGKRHALLAIKASCEKLARAEELLRAQLGIKIEAR